MASNAYDVIVIGGGPAGCGAAIPLARRGFRVLLLEKARLPVHKLCGEFLSVEVTALFERLGVAEAVRRARPHPIGETLVTTADGAAFRSPLPGTGLGLSRRTLDRLLFTHAADAGADARDGVTALALTGSLADGFTVTTTEGTFTARLALGAWGKRGLLDRKLDRRFLDEKSPFVAFKAHFEGIEIPGVVELHAFRGGYCGLSHVEDGRVNVCWITHRDRLREAGGRPGDMIAHTFGENAALARRFERMRRVTDFCAVAQVAFAVKGPMAGDVPMIGDTAGMIAPLCGDGMAMALRSAEAAAMHAAAFLEGRADAEAFRRDYAQAWREAFARRMRLGRWMHRGYVHPLAAGLGVRALAGMPALGRWLIRHTRDAAHA
ncbi:NAD(P)/FAD-dependent oxidoreductase [Rhodocaloribacter sp.]